MFAPPNSLVFHFSLSNSLFYFPPAVEFSISLFFSSFIRSFSSPPACLLLLCVAPRRERVLFPLCFSISIHFSLFAFTSLVSLPFCWIHYSLFSISIFPFLSIDRDSGSSDSIFWIFQLFVNITHLHSRLRLRKICEPYKLKLIFEKCL